MSILSRFDFKGCQHQAATDPNRAIAVTAGAGSGKTTALVGRYLYLLEQGLPLRSIVAITFTDKAAREMRTRIRKELGSLLLPEEGTGLQAACGDSAPREPAPLEAAPLDAAPLDAAPLEAARIGTIHSLCAEILRAHPAEAGLDPSFVVLEEGLAAAYRHEAITAALAWAANDPQAALLFGVFRESDLRHILVGWMGKDGDGKMGAGQPQSAHWERALERWLEGNFAGEWRQALAELATRRAANPDDKLELARQAVLAHWSAVEQAVGAKEWDAAFRALADLRKAVDARSGRKDAWALADLEAVRQGMGELKAHYDATLKPVAEKCRWTLDEHLARLLPALHLLKERAEREYEGRKDERQALDFDDLECRAARLLGEHPAVRARWQAECRAVLVDEFQDTNDRQRQIVYALSQFEPARPGDASPSPTGQGKNSPASLFVVGDAKQSIYKFRHADVTVFRRVQADIQAAGGLALDLDLTFRAHATLLEGLNTLLAPILGPAEVPAQPFRVPFAPLRAYRQEPRPPGLQPPYIEFHLGLGEGAAEGRLAAARALAERLQALHAAGEFAWGDMALLFRASTGFHTYEAALERAGIPFVTIAGRGFYDRPEIRDLLNALAAIADPRDDLALAGLLRSPAFGLSDAHLYRLLFPPAESGPHPSEDGRLWEALQAAGPWASTPAHQRAVTILNELHTLSGRAPAAAVLKRLLDLTGYPALLAAAPEGARMARNVDKLLADAHRSRLVNLGEFLEYVQTVRDVGLRESEAPVDAGGAVQLMTVHKSKGLQFPLVVLADAAHEHRGGGGKILQDAELGLLLDVRDEEEYRPVAWQLASLLEAERDDAEDCRLLYVAATRVQEKLLVSGHARVKKDGTLSLAGWLGRLGAPAGMEERRVDAGAGPCSLDGSAFPVWIYPSLALGPEESALAPQRRTLSVCPGDLVAPYSTPETVLQVDEKARHRQADPPERVWRVVSRAKKPMGPAWVVGQLVHRMLQYWRFPGDEADFTLPFDDFLRPLALELGLTDAAEIHATVREVRRLLERLRAHPVFAEMDAAERHHELPYLLPEGGGILDLLYRTPQGWFIADFKTDEVSSEAEALETIRREGYDRQVARYAEAVAAQLGVRPHTRLVFLRVGGEPHVFDGFENLAAEPSGGVKK